MAELQANQPKLCTPCVRFCASLKQLFLNYQKEIKSRSINFQSWLLVLYVIATVLCLVLGNNIALSITTNPEDSSCFTPVPKTETRATYVVAIIQNSIICLLFPFTGWLADIKIGHEKAINLSLWCCWLGTLLQVISYCIQYGTCGLPVNIAKYGISTLALILIMFGTASSLSNVLPYGLNQLVYRSNASIRSFIHWLIWGLFLGFSVSYLAFVYETIYQPTVLLVTGLIIFLAISVALCLHASFKHKFAPSGVLKRNPYKLVYQVLKYAWQHKSPENRSALTYWKTKIPSRINLGKKKYGGPFNEGEVEDVKTFLRIIGILICTFGFHIAFYPGFLGAFQYINSFEGATSTLNGYGSYVLWDGFDKIIVVLIPVVELLIIPLFPKLEYFLLNSLRGIVILYGLLLIALISMIIITTIGHYYTPYYVPCLVISAENVIQLSYYYFSIPLFFAGITSGLRFLLSFEFIVSQAPSNLAGMLVGAFWLIQALYLNIGAWLQIPFTVLTLDGPGRLPCTFWILLIQILICLSGMVVFVVAVKKYRGRKRDEDYNFQAIIEETYERFLQREVGNTTFELNSPYDFYIIVDNVDLN